jgi:hypothetical protein
MERSELTELQYIVLLRSVPTICKLGILSHNRAEKLRAESIAQAEVQAIRAKKQVPQGRPLHDYVNLYLCARNPMMYKVQHRHGELAVLRVDTAVLDLPGVVVTDGNASSEYIRFRAAPDGLRYVDKDAVFAEWWTDSDPIMKLRKKTWKCGGSRAGSGGAGVHHGRLRLRRLGAGGVQKA